MKDCRAQINLKVIDFTVSKVTGIILLQVLVPVRRQELFFYKGCKRRMCDV